MSNRAQRAAARNVGGPNAPPNPGGADGPPNNAQVQPNVAQNVDGGVNAPSPGVNAAAVPVAAGAGGNPGNPVSLVDELLQTCGANQDEIHALETVERINSLLQLRRLDDRAMSELASRLEKRSEPHRVQLPMAVLQNMKVLSYWLKRQH